MWRKGCREAEVSHKSGAPQSEASGSSLPLSLVRSVSQLLLPWNLWLQLTTTPLSWKTPCLLSF